MTQDPLPTATRETAGTLSDGSVVDAITLDNGCGITARVLSYGATLQSLIAPAADGSRADVVLGHDDVAGYEAIRGFLGVTVGRYANRIAGGRFVIDGVPHAIDRNEGENTLHGGAAGFDRAVWTVEAVAADGESASVVLGHVSPDGAGGFPGELRCTVTYRLDTTGALTIAFMATTTKPTVVNLTNHALFNLAGDGALQGAMLHRLTIPASTFVAVDEQSIPTGELRDVAGTPFDFREGRVVAEGLRCGSDPQIAIGHGYDHTFALDKGQTALPEPAARLEDPVSGRRLDVLTTEPGVQLFTANFFDGCYPGKRGGLYRMGDGIALEPQKFPDTPNQPAFGSARLNPGETYRHTMVYRLSVIDNSSEG